MLAQTIFLQDKSTFSTTIAPALTEKGAHIEPFENVTDLPEDVDSVVVFHDQHNFDKNTADLRDQFERMNVAMHKIDLSGTLNVAISHLSLFFERTKSKKVVFIGSENLKDHPKMQLFKENWK